MGNAREIGNNLLNIIIYPLLSGFITIVFLTGLFIITNKIDISSILLFLSIQNHKTLINLGLSLLTILTYLLGMLNIQIGEEISSSGNTPTNEIIKALDGDNWNKELEKNVKIDDFIKAGINNNIWIVKSEYIFTTSRFFTSIFPAILLSYLLFAIYKILIFLGESGNLISNFLKLIFNIKLNQIIILTIPIVITIIIKIITKIMIITKIIINTKIIKILTKKFTMKFPPIVKFIEFFKKRASSFKKRASSGAKFPTLKYIVSLYYCESFLLLSKTESLINTTTTVTVIISSIIAMMSFAIGTKLREEANLFLKLGAKSNDYLSDKGNGQHLCSPHDSSTKPQ